MKELFILSIIASFLGTLIGGVVGAFFSKPNSRQLGYLLGLSSGIMIGVTVFDILPDAIDNGNVFLVCIFVLISVIMFSFLSNMIVNINTNKSIPTLGIILLIAMSIHNFPEGLAIGAVSSYDYKSGLIVAFVIVVHDIFEAVVIACSFRKDNVSIFKTIIIVLISSIFTFLGAIVGIVFTISNKVFVPISLSIASGAMLYITFVELIPEANKYTSKEKVVFFIIIGILLSMLLVFTL